MCGGEWLAIDEITPKISDVYVSASIAPRSSLEPVDGDLSPFVSQSDAEAVLAFLEETEEWLYAPEEEDKSAPEKVRTYGVWRVLVVVRVVVVVGARCSGRSWRG